MDITETPCVRHLGISKTSDGALQLSNAPALHNHLETIHAGALFTLAETASAEALRLAFPDLVGRVMPVIRDAQVRLRKPATGTVSAVPSLAEGSSTGLRTQLAKKGRGGIMVEVVLTDDEGDIVLTGSFHWHVQLRT